MQQLHQVMVKRHQCLGEALLIQAFVHASHSLSSSPQLLQMLAHAPQLSPRIVQECLHWQSVSLKGHTSATIVAV